MNATEEIPLALREELMRLGSEAWDEFRQHADGRHHLFIPCDQAAGYEELLALRERASSFLELGSGAGVMTILASLLGYEAHGIEIESWLVRRSSELAEHFDCGAQFAEGSFVPLAYQEEVSLLSAEFHTPAEGDVGYDELGSELDDYDLVFAYPWPGDEEWLDELMRRHARPDAILLTFDAKDGYRWRTVEELGPSSLEEDGYDEPDEDGDELDEDDED